MKYYYGTYNQVIRWRRKLMSVEYSVNLVM